MLTRLSRVLPVVMLAAVLAGCGGGGAQSTTQVTTKTLGQELTDLKTAYEAGAMSEKEYNKAREALLDKYK